MEILSYIYTNGENVASMVLFGIGLICLLFHQNLIKKIIGLNIMDTATYMYLAAQGYISGRAAPIVENGTAEMEAYINPIPSGLVLTGIVVSVSVSAVMLALTVLLYERYHSLNMDYIIMRMRQEEDQ